MNKYITIITQIGIWSFGILIKSRISVRSKSIVFYEDKLNLSSYEEIQLKNEDHQISQNQNESELLESMFYYNISEEFDSKNSTGIFLTSNSTAALFSENFEEKGEWTILIICGLFIATCLIKGLPVLYLRIVYGPAPRMPKEHDKFGKNRKDSLTNSDEMSNTTTSTEIYPQVENCTKL